MNALSIKIAVGDFVHRVTVELPDSLTLEQVKAIRDNVRFGSGKLIDVTLHSG